MDTAICTGGTRSEIGHCCTSNNPCDIHQGDCDNDSHCKGNLICGKNNCGSAFTWTYADCCIEKGGKYSVLN